MDNFWGDLTDVSAEKEALVKLFSKLYLIYFGYFDTININFFSNVNTYFFG